MSVGDSLSETADDIGRYYWIYSFTQQGTQLINTMKTTISNETSLSGLVAVMSATSDFVKNDDITSDIDAVVCLFSRLFHLDCICDLLCT